ncbi:HAD family hydrolase [Exilibacterium tricleocarpae]|uniref:HAD family hydrolase n=1 Tax=Exilibacterium tricleocarpae TaxID=2591008 RepID=A0A545TAN5_9GAMM|nr:HAD hydrolase-like protein [Exilibacterium tricleocarpae]TQV74275.1 HAD family hydrolase [Exilibacterium tricleocarpae]
MLPPPKVILFDWHGTLVDTLDAMYRTMEEMLPQLEELDLVRRLQPETRCADPDDAKLVRYIRIFRRLHPRILAERRVSRTEIFNAIFAGDPEARRIAHDAYNRCYRGHYGDVKPFQEGIYDYLLTLHKLGIQLGVATNRSREFLEHELRQVDGGRWAALLPVRVSADDVARYKPAPDVIHQALKLLDTAAGPAVWYLGDSQTDMLTAHNAGVTPVFYNGAHWDERWIDRLRSKREPTPEAPAAVVNGFDQLLDQLEGLETRGKAQFAVRLRNNRPPAYPPRAAPPPRIEPDWHPSLAQLTAPALILFDWHATLVDTLDAMYHAVDDMLPEIETLGLVERLLPAAESKSPEDAKLVEHVRHYRQLHPRIKIDRKISRTDIFEVLFGDDQQAKQIAHRAFNRHYRKHYGTVLPFEPQVRNMLQGLRDLGLVLGVITNRDREFFEHELAAVEGTGWSELFDTEVCGDDTPQRKPHPDQLQLATRTLGFNTGPQVWYVGDSTTDTIAAKRAGVTSVFFNGAQWDQPWLEKIFPGSTHHPHQPDVVVNDFSEFWALVLCLLPARK